MISYSEALEQIANIVVAYKFHPQLGIDSIVIRSSTLSVLYKLPRNTVERQLRALVKSKE